MAVRCQESCVGASLLPLIKKATIGKSGGGDDGGGGGGWCWW